LEVFNFKVVWFGWKVWVMRGGRSLWLFDDWKHLFDLVAEYSVFRGGALRTRSDVLGA
jgi:hypothetical protein